MKILVPFFSRILTWFSLRNNKNLNRNSYLLYKTTVMHTSLKRDHQESGSTEGEPEAKSLRLAQLRHGRNRPVTKSVQEKLTDDDLDILENITTSSCDLIKIKAAVTLRIKHRLSIRLPEDMNDSSYYFMDGLRFVYPYNYIYQSYAKHRWVNRKLMDVVKDEFRDIPDDQLSWRFEQERIIVNGDPVPSNYVLKYNDFICNRNHRHELPVLAAPIKILYQDKDTLVVNKPPSVPTHACGRYRHNSLVHILEKEYNFQNLKTVHRLDRLTSGVLIIALNSTRANFLETAIKNREVQKEYVCRVAGEFPDGEILVEQPLEIIPGKIGITVVDPNGKHSSTLFKRLNYNGKSSAVLCKPKTGRMHQIRAHLQYLGHPIVNDLLYNCDAFGPERGKGGRYGKSLAQLQRDVLNKHRADTWLIHEASDILNSGETAQSVAEVDAEKSQKTVSYLSDDERMETLAALSDFYNDQSYKQLELKWAYDPNKLVVDTTCRDCAAKYHNPPMRNQFMYLHAFKYAGASWSYESPMPVWALESWIY